MAAEIGAIHLNRAGNCHVLHFRRKRFADLVSHDESRLVLHVEIAGKLEGAMALGAVDEDGDSKEVVADRQLAAGEDGAQRDRELMRASLALIELAGLVGEGFGAGATRANRLAVSGRPTDVAEGVVGFLVAHTRDLRQTDSPGSA